MTDPKVTVIAPPGVKEQSMEYLSLRTVWMHSY